MKKFEVDVDITMSCRIEVDAESEEQARTIVGNWIGDDPWQYVRDGHYMSHEFEAVRESEEKPAEKLTFKELCDKLSYFSVVNNQSKTIGEIADECRVFIRDSGHQCLDECYDEESAAKEWAEEHHPEWDDEELEQSSVLYQPLQFLCKSKYDRDLHFADLAVTFYGDYKEGVGVFGVSTE